MTEINLQWWKSSTGAGISRTIKGLIGTFIPVILGFLGVEIINAQIDAIIDAVIVLISATIAVSGYVRAKSK